MSKGSGFPVSPTPPTPPGPPHGFRIADIITVGDLREELARMESEAEVWVVHAGTPAISPLAVREASQVPDETGRRRLQLSVG
jgi:hypothetical protein